MNNTVSMCLDAKLKKITTGNNKLFLLTSWYRRMYPYIPYVTGNLANNIEIKEDGIHFNVPYATRQYYGEDFNFTKDFHPLAQAKWGQVAMDLHFEEIVNEFKNHIRSELND